MEIIIGKLIKCACESNQINHITAKVQINVQETLERSDNSIFNTKSMFGRSSYPKVPDNSTATGSDGNGRRLGRGSLKVPVIELPYWEKVTEERGVTLHSWELGIATLSKWPFATTQFETWAEMRFEFPRRRRPESASIFASDSWKLALQALSQKALCTQDQEASLYQLFSHPESLQPGWPWSSNMCSCIDCEDFSSSAADEGCEHVQLPKYRSSNWSVCTLSSDVPNPDFSGHECLHQQQYWGYDPYDFCKNCQLASNSVNAYTYGHFYCEEQSLRAVAAAPGRSIFPVSADNHNYNWNAYYQSQYIWLSLARFLFQIPLIQTCNDSSPRARPTNSARTTFIEASIFQYLDLGLSCALITAWFDPHRRPSMLGATIPIKPLTISALQKRAKQALTERLTAVTPTQNTQLVGTTIASSTIAHPYDIPPLRLWDLKMNRVIPWYLIDDPTAKTPPSFIAISHSWVDEEDRVLVDTPINRFAWPVPLPEGVTLEAIREEVLAAFPSFRYCWLDVLCLRQQARASMDEFPIPSDYMPSTLAALILLRALCLERDLSSKDHLRATEHHIDVPTIGNIYKLAKGVFRYFNGLGRPFCEEHWNHPSHWLNRTWTLQETISGSIDGGVARWSTGSHLNVLGSRGGVRKRFREFISEIEGMTGEPVSVIPLAQEMGRRHATSEIDKITGLSYLLKVPRLPIYKADMGVNSAWNLSLWEMPKKHLLDLLLKCPLVDSSRWTPSWIALSSLPPTFVPYPDPSPASSTVADIRRRFFDIFGELEYPKSVVQGMYETLIPRYSAFGTGSTYSDPFALNKEQLVSSIERQKREMVKELDDDSSNSLRNDKNSVHRNDGISDQDSIEDDSDSYVSTVRAFDKLSASHKLKGTRMDRELGVCGWYLKVHSLSSTGGINYCLEIRTSARKIEKMKFFVSHDGIELNLAKSTISSGARMIFPGTRLILFTRGLACSEYLQHSEKQRTVIPKPQARCSAWLVLRSTRRSSTTYQKIGVLRSDEIFSYQWMTKGLLRAHLNSGRIFMDTMKLDPHPENDDSQRLEDDLNN